MVLGTDVMAIRLERRRRTELKAAAMRAVVIRPSGVIPPARRAAGATCRAGPLWETAMAARVSEWIIRPPGSEKPPATTRATEVIDAKRWLSAGCPQRNPCKRLIAAMHFIGSYTYGINPVILLV